MRDTIFSSCMYRSERVRKKNGYVDLSILSVEELGELRARIDQEVNARKVKEQALQEIIEFAKQRGLSLDELGFATAKKSQGSKPVASKYRNPEDTSMTWTGRGKRPKWVQAALDSGKTLDDLMIA